MSEVAYFKSGESVSVQAGVNGFIVYAEEGEIIAVNPEQLMNIVLGTLTNHHELVKAQEAAKAAEELPEPEQDEAA